MLYLTNSTLSPCHPFNTDRTGSGKPGGGGRLEVILSDTEWAVPPGQARSYLSRDHSSHGVATADHCGLVPNPGSSEFRDSLVVPGPRRRRARTSTVRSVAPGPSPSPWH
eukprot:748060-Hanusia_phi.AAC.1